MCPIINRLQSLNLINGLCMAVKYQGVVDEHSIDVFQHDVFGKEMRKAAVMISGNDVNVTLP